MKIYEEMKSKINNAVFMLQISKKVDASQLVVNNKVYEKIQSYIVSAEKDGVLKGYFCGLEVIIDNSTKEFEVR